MSNSQRHYPIHGETTGRRMGLTYKGLEAILMDPMGNTYKTTFKNFCWIVPTCHNLHAAMKISSKPSFDPYKWHVRLGHASELVVRSFLKEHYPEEITGPWQSFFCKRCAVSKSLDRKTPGVELGIAWDNPMDLFVTDVRVLLTRIL